MTDNEFELSRRKVLAGLGTIGVASAGAGLGTSAWLSDQESFMNNRLVAGTLDLKVSWDEHYFDGIDNLGDGPTDGLQYVDGAVGDGQVGFPSSSDSPTLAVDDDLVGDFMAATRQERFPEGGLGDADPCEALADVPQDLEAPVIELDDVKPGDFGEVTFDFSLCSNPGYVWLTGLLRDENENGVMEPEPEDDTGDGSDGDGDASAGSDGGGVSTASSHELSATALDGSSLTPEDLADSLIGDASEVDIVDGSVNFDGDQRGGGAFSGGSDAIGVGEGIVLSSGNVEDVEGPNDSATTTTELGTSGDPDLDALAGDSTENASILEFEFEVPDDAEQVFFTYVFGSEEYNEYVGSEFNDVFGFFVNGENVAEVPDPDNPGETLPAAINNINNGQPAIEPTNPDLYVNNDPHDPDSTGSTVPEAELADTEMDGFTVPLTIEADVDPGETNTMKLAVADTSDAVLDSWVLIEGGSLDTEPPEPEPEPETESELPDAVQARVWYDDGDNVHQDGEQVVLEGTLREVLDALSSGEGVPLDGDESTETDFDETGGDPMADSRDCYAADGAVHYLGFEWWIPTTVGNEIQSDSVTFDLGFYAEQCRHNDGNTTTVS